MISVPLGAAKENMKQELKKEKRMGGSRDPSLCGGSPDATRAGVRAPRAPEARIKSRKKAEAERKIVAKALGIALALQGRGCAPLMPRRFG